MTRESESKKSLVLSIYYLVVSTMLLALMVIVISRNGVEQGKCTRPNFTYIATSEQTAVSSLEAAARVKIYSDTAAGTGYIALRQGELRLQSIGHVLESSNVYMVDIAAVGKYTFERASIVTNKNNGEFDAESYLPICNTTLATELLRRLIHLEYSVVLPATNAEYRVLGTGISEADQTFRLTGSDTAKNLWQLQLQSDQMVCSGQSGSPVLLSTNSGYIAVATISALNQPEVVQGDYICGTSVFVRPNTS